MPATPLLSQVEPSDATAQVERLATQIRAMEGAPQGHGLLPSLPALEQVVPGGLSRGSAYEVEGSLTLATALLAGPSSAGAWCAVVGVPEWGAEAAVGIGVDLERTLIVPAPGERWVHVVTTLADVAEVILVRPSTVVREAEAQRVVARLRKQESTLVVLADQPKTWPRPRARLAVAESAWSGLGKGHGHLQGRRLTVVAEGRWGRPRRTTLLVDGGAMTTTAMTTTAMTTTATRTPMTRCDTAPVAPVEGWAS